MITNLSQNTAEWENFRSSRIGASDASAILGISPWKSAYRLYEEKLGIRGSKTNYAMQRGHELELEALKSFKGDGYVHFSPKVFVHPEYNFLMASLDGISDDLQIAVEIKCNGKENHKLALEGKVPDYYNSQLQHQMFVCELDHIFYYSFDGKYGVSIQVNRDEAFIKTMLEKELRFYECMIEYIPPPLTSKDYVRKENQRFQDACSQLQAVREQLKELEKKEEYYKNILIDEANGVNCEGYGIRVSKVTRNGAIDYKKVPELIGVDLEKFRSNQTISWRINEFKGEYE